MSGTFEASSVPILQIDVVKFVPRASQGRTSNPCDHLYIVLHPYPDLGRRGIWMRQNHEKQLTISFMMKLSLFLATNLWIAQLAATKLQTRRFHHCFPFARFKASDLFGIMEKRARCIYCSSTSVLHGWMRQEATFCLTRRSNRVVPYYVTEVQFLATGSDMLIHEMQPIDTLHPSLRTGQAALRFLRDW